MLGRYAPSRKACAKTRAVLGIANRLIFWREHRFDAWRFEDFTTPTVRFDVDDSVVERFVQYAGLLLRPNGRLPGCPMDYWRCADPVLRKEDSPAFGPTKLPVGTKVVPIVHTTGNVRGLAAE